MREALSQPQKDALGKMRQVLSEEFLTLSVSDYSLTEHFAEERCSITCNVIEGPKDRVLRIEGSGVGMLDAFFHGLCAVYEQEHPSLSTIKFTSFSVKGLMSEAKSGPASDAMAEAFVGVTNSSGNRFQFAAVSHSVSHSSLEAVLAAVEYFVNSERAYLKTYMAMEHYRREGRADLVAKYTHLLSDLVRNTSYSSAIERMKQQR